MKGGKKMITKNTRYFAMIALVCMLITTFTFLLPISADEVTGSYVNE